LVIALVSVLASMPSHAEDAKAETARKKGGFPGLLRSPEVSPDRHVTFRLRAPNATQVSVTGELPVWRKYLAEFAPLVFRGD